VICLSDNGGTGKSLFVGQVVSALFGRDSVNANCRMSDFAGQFNGHLAGKLAILLNENCEESYNHNAMKQIAGSERITFTNKNQMPYEGDNTALLFVSGNSLAGSIRLSGGDVDRRFSVIKGGSNLESYVRPYLEAEFGHSVSHDEAKAWIVSTGQRVLGDPVEAGKWLNALIERHGRIAFVHPLHGADYRSVVTVQTSLIDQVFERVFDEDFSYIRKSTMYDFYRHEARIQGNRTSYGKKKFYKAAEDWLAQHKRDIVAATANWDESTADVLVCGNLLGTRSKPKLKPNDGFYFYDNGLHRIWNIEL
jgi:hypothetical protein